MVSAARSAATAGTAGPPRLGRQASRDRPAAAARSTATARRAQGAPVRPGRSADRARAPHLRVVKGSEPGRRHSAATFLWIGAIAFALALVVLVVTQVMLTQATYRVAEAETDLTRARGEYERARLERAQAESPTRIEERARRELGMIPAERPEALALGPEDSNREPEPSAAGSGEPGASGEPGRQPAGPP